MRAQAYQEYTKFQEACGRRPRPDDEVARQQWRVEHGLGFCELRNAYAQQGRHGY